jgi:hypothetical protein
MFFLLFLSVFSFIQIGAEVPVEDGNKGRRTRSGQNGNISGQDGKSAKRTKRK